MTEHGCHNCGEERVPRVVAGKATCPECGSENIVNLGPEVSGNDVADEAADARHKAREAIVRRACEAMGWDYKTSPAYAGIRQVALGNGVAISVEKLHELLDRISPRPGRCEHGVCDGEWCEPCNRAMKDAARENTLDGDEPPRA